MEDGIEVPLKTRNKTTYASAIPLIGIYPEETRVEKDTCIPLFIAALFTTATTWKQPRCPSTNEWKNKLWYIHTMEYYSAIKRNNNSEKREDMAFIFLHSSCLEYAHDLQHSSSYHEQGEDSLMTMEHQDQRMPTELSYLLPFWIILHEWEIKFNLVSATDICGEKTLLCCT